MTQQEAENRAGVVCREWVQVAVCSATADEPPTLAAALENERRLRETIAAAIRAAVAEEREACCAALASEEFNGLLYDNQPEGVAQVIETLKAIRARGQS